MAPKDEAQLFGWLGCRVESNAMVQNHDGVFLFFTPAQSQLARLAGI